jgi:hypothetical protein
MTSAKSFTFAAEITINLKFRKMGKGDIDGDYLTSPPSSPLIDSYY